MRYDDRLAGFTATIWQWFSRCKRTLPWRDLPPEDLDDRAYRILVSEIMLQQTQVPRVEVIFRSFLRTFPTLEALGHASNKEVLIAWRGMGYNSRALRLRDAALRIVEGRGGEFPTEMEELQSISGIGHYTAAAIRNFAFHIPTPCLDTNIRRILHRVFVGPENHDGTWKKEDAFLLTIADDVLSSALETDPDRTTADWHAALMDFGSLVCTKRNPKWDICPLTNAGLMKTTARNFPKHFPLSTVHYPLRREPGRTVGGVFVPNRIFRGRVVEELRDASKGLTLEQIGKRITVDWSAREHRDWLKALLEKLKKDALISQKKRKFVLS
ncbi:MAG: hypothetical protein Q7R81_05560 [Candidatus Peregrinibacteria bacterium]|nr:hypothetical protein [Candidatus Peregrinibacteria bacterium]